LYGFLMSHDNWFIAWVTIGLLHVFLLAPRLLHVFLMSRDTWFIAWVTLDLLHVFLLTLGLLYVLISHDTWFIARVTLGLLHVLVLARVNTWHLFFNVFSRREVHSIWTGSNCIQHGMVDVNMFRVLEFD
jgi:hypothetical protein